MEYSVQATEGYADVVDSIVQLAKIKLGKRGSGMCRKRMRQLLGEYKVLRLAGLDHNAACSKACVRVNTNDAYKKIFADAVTAAAREDASSRHLSRRVIRTAA